MDTNELKQTGPGPTPNPLPATRAPQGIAARPAGLYPVGKVQSLAQGNLIGNVPVAVSQKALMDLITGMYAYCGRNALSAVDLAAEASLLDSTVRKDFAMLSLPEVIEAINSGIRAEAAADYADLSRRKFEALLTAYRGGILRKEVLAARQSTQEKPPVSANENRRAGINLCCNVFEDYRKGAKRDASFYGVVFDVLWRERLLRFDKQRSEDIREQAKLAVLKELNAQKASPFGLPASERAEIRRTLDKFAREPEKAEKWVSSKAREIAVKEYFDGLIEMGQELKDMFE